MAANDLVTLTETKASLRLPSNASDGLLAAWVSAVSVRVDELCGPVVNRTITDEFHDGGWPSIYPRFVPVSSVTSLSEYDSAGTVTALSAEDYDTKPASAFLVDGEVVRRRASGADALFVSGRRNVRLTYVAGRVASTAAVTEQFKRAALVIVAHMWREEHGQASTSFAGDDGLVTVGAGWAIPRRARDLLGNEMRPQASFA